MYAKFGTNGPLGLAVRGLGYDASDDAQFALTDSTQFDSAGVAPSGPADGAASMDPADHYREGWFTGIWTYATASGNPFAGGAWTFARLGPTSRDLTDGAWDSWAFTNTFSQAAAAANAASATAAADFDSDGRVDGADFLRWQTMLGLPSGVLRSQGDATGDGAIDAADLAAWQDQILSAPAASAINAATAGVAAPEPDSLTTCASAMFVLFPYFLRRIRSAS